MVIYSSTMENTIYSIDQYLEEWKEALYDVINDKKILIWHYNKQNVIINNNLQNTFEKKYKPSYSKLLALKIKHVSTIIKILYNIFTDNKNKKFEFGRPPDFNYDEDSTKFSIQTYYTDLQGIQKLKMNIDVDDYYLYFTNFTINIIVSNNMHEYHIIRNDSTDGYRISNPSDDENMEYDDDDGDNYDN